MHTSAPGRARPPTSAPALGSLLPRLHRRWAHPPTSAPRDCRGRVVGALRRRPARERADNEGDSVVRLKYSYYDVLVLYPRTRSRERKTGRTRRRYQQDLFGLKTADEAVPPQSCQCSALQCREHPARRQRPRLCRRRERSFSTARRATTWSSRRRSWRGGCITTTLRDALAGAASPRSGCGNICPRMRLPAVANPFLGAYLCSLARATAPSPVAAT